MPRVRPAPDPRAAPRGGRHLSGVGVTWYTWLEQGRDITASAQVIDALARALLLTPSQHRHLRELAGLPPPQLQPPAEAMLPRLQLLVDTAAPSPASVYDRHFDYLAWNQPYVRVRHDPGTLQKDRPVTRWNTRLARRGMGMRTVAGVRAWVHRWPEPFPAIAGFGSDLTTPGRLAPDTADVGDADVGETGQPTWLAGNLGGAWRIGGTVHRTTGPWTVAVHALLDFLASRLEHTPRVLGFDEQGREVLTFLPGRVVDIDSELLTPGQIDSLVSWTRSFHEAVAGFGHPGPWRYPRVPRASLIGHNDIAPYNVCFDGDDVAGVFDWDLAGPTTPLMELAFIAWNCVPLWRDIGDAASAERMRRICSAYGGVHPTQIVDVVPGRIQMMLDWIPLGAAAGDTGLRRLMSQGEPKRSQAALNELVPRLRRIRLLLD